MKERKRRTRSLSIVANNGDAPDEVTKPASGLFVLIEDGERAIEGKRILFSRESHNDVFVAVPFAAYVRARRRQQPNK